MAFNWEEATRFAHSKTNDSGGIFVRLSDNGDKVVGAFCGDPLPREVVWAGSRYENYDPKQHVDLKPSFRVSLNFYVPDEKVMKVIEGGITWFKDILKIRDKYGLDNWFFEIERHGEAGDPKTTYTILPEEKITAEQKEEIARVRLHDLAGLVGLRSIQKDDQPIDEQTALKIITALKELPRSEVDTFLSQFQIERVRDMRESDVKAAFQLLDGLLTQASKAKSQTFTEVDPFA